MTGSLTSFVRIAWLVTLSFLASSASSAAPKILVFGDSLSAAYGIPIDRSWVTLLQLRLQQHGYPHQVVNASISGETAGGGRARLPDALQRHRPDVLIVELGANDGLRGFDIARTKQTLREMISLSTSSEINVLLLGIKLPANYGKVYGEKFHQMYLDLAEEADIALVPFFLKGVAETRDLMQADGVHPSAAAQPRILENVWPVLALLLQ